MNVIMSEYYQGADIAGVLEPGKQYEVSDKLGAWLVENHKASEVVTVSEHRHFEVEPQFEQAEEPPKPEAEKVQPKRRRGRKDEINSITSND